jgi:hypothetical protein
MPVSENFVIRELHFSDGYARMSCEDTFEAWALHDHRGVIEAESGINGGASFRILLLMR